MTTERTTAVGRALDAVVIGASSGGIEALSILLPSLSPELRVPVFIVLHLPRDRPSLLVDIFAPKCRAPVREAEDKQPVQAGIVYFAPPDYHLLIDAGPALAISADEPVNFSRPSIDVLFESAAEVYGSHLMGVILTGASHDGAAGLDTIRRAGGCTVVQCPETAQSRLMTDAALERGPADFVLPLEEIAVLVSSLEPRTETTTRRTF